MEAGMIGLPELFLDSLQPPFRQGDPLLDTFFGIPDYRVFDLFRFYLCASVAQHQVNFIH